MACFYSNGLLEQSQLQAPYPDTSLFDDGPILNLVKHARNAGKISLLTFFNQRRLTG